MADGEETKTCPTCRSDVGKSKFDLHSAYCARNNVLCRKCNVAVRSVDYDEHLKEEHEKVRCNRCNQQLEKYQLADHEEDSCPKRLVSCKYCEMEFAFVELGEHDDTCGSRTDECKECGKRLQLRHMEGHLQEHKDISSALQSSLSDPMPANQPVDTGRSHSAKRLPSLKPPATKPSPFPTRQNLQGQDLGGTSNSARSQSSMLGPSSGSSRRSHSTGNRYPSTSVSSSNKRQPVERSRPHQGRKHDTVKRVDRSPWQTSSEASSTALKSKYTNFELDEMMSNLLSQDNLESSFEPPRSEAVKRERESRNPNPSDSSKSDFRYFSVEERQPSPRSDPPAHSSAMENDKEIARLMQMEEDALYLQHQQGSFNNGADFTNVGVADDAPVRDRQLAKALRDADEISAKSVGGYGSYRDRSPSVGEEDSSGLPCEFCEQLFSPDNLAVHQYTCRQRTNRYEGLESATGFTSSERPLRIDTGTSVPVLVPVRKPAGSTKAEMLPHPHSERKSLWGEDSLASFKLGEPSEPSMPDHSPPARDVGPQRFDESSRRPSSGESRLSATHRSNQREEQSILQHLTTGKFSCQTFQDEDEHSSDDDAPPRSDSPIFEATASERRQRRQTESVGSARDSTEPRQRAMQRQESEEDVVIPCEVCGKGFPLKGLMQHQLICSMEAQVKAKKPPASEFDSTPGQSPLEDDSEHLPCEFCDKPFPANKVWLHQLECPKKRYDLFSERWRTSQGSHHDRASDQQSTRERTPAYDRPGYTKATDSSRFQSDKPQLLQNSPTLPSHSNTSAYSSSLLRRSDATKEKLARSTFGGDHREGASEWPRGHGSKPDQTDDHTYEEVKYRTPVCSDSSSSKLSHTYEKVEYSTPSVCSDPSSSEFPTVSMFGNESSSRSLLQPSDRLSGRLPGEGGHSSLPYRPRHSDLAPSFTRRPQRTSSRDSGLRLQPLSLPAGTSFMRTEFSQGPTTAVITAKGPSYQSASRGRSETNTSHRNQGDMADGPNSSVSSRRYDVRTTSLLSEQLEGRQHSLLNSRTLSSLPATHRQGSVKDGYRRNYTSGELAIPASSTRQSSTGSRSFHS